MKAIHLQTEYLTTPIGLGIKTPRFYWNCEGGKKQTAYRLIARNGREVVWDSGKVNSDSMTHILYQGEPLKSRERIKWSVQLWDENDVPGEEAESWFELGFLEETDWRAKWITGDYKAKKDARWPVDCFRRKFSARQDIKRARLYITACGIYEASLNGRRVGEFVFAPGCTDYRKRLQYQVYNVTDMLKEENELEVQLADGWYRGSIGCFGVTNVFGRMTKLLCQLEVFYKDGSRDILCSDGEWEWSNDGSIRFADLKDGEVVDASMNPSYNGKVKIAQEELLPVASDNVHPKEQEVFSARLLTTPSGKKVLDFGQNIAGYIAFTVQGEKGRRMKLTCGEMLDENGEFTQKNMQVYKPVKEFGKIAEMLLISGKGDKLKGEMQPTPRQEIFFTCSGGKDSYKSKFTVFGFRYALIETDIDFRAENFRAVAVYSDLEQSGEFICSHEGVNQLVKNTRWSMKGNYLDVPTDCPTRERLGWTGDAQVFFDTGAYLMNVAPFFRKWMRDVQDNQFKNGKISAVVPYNGAPMLYDSTGASVGWGDCAVLLPYRYWKRYGDISMIRDFYGVMRGYAMYMIKNTGHKDKNAAKANPFNKYTYEKGIHLGEWLEPEEFKDDMYKVNQILNTEECTAYLHFTMKHIAETARELGKEEDEKLFSEYADGAKRAYRWLFLEKGIPETDRQAKLVRPLAFGLADTAPSKTTGISEKEGLEIQLAKAVENRKYRIGTGFLSTPFVLGTLTEIGRSDLAYKMLENEESPGWLYEVKSGATTVWENWEGNEGSMNHYSPGAVCQWLFDTVAGIRVAGENRFEIAPVPGGTLTFAQARYRSLYGEVRSRWEKTDGEIRFVVEIPPNTEAEIRLPDGEKKTVQGGRHCFLVKDQIGRETGK